MLVRVRGNDRIAWAKAYNILRSRRRARFWPGKGSANRRSSVDRWSINSTVKMANTGNMDLEFMQQAMSAMVSIYMQPVILLDIKGFHHACSKFSFGAESTLSGAGTPL